MVYMPYEVLDKSSVDLEDPDTVYQFYSKLLTSGGLYSDTKLRMGNARERLADILHIPEGETFLILEEELYSEYDTPVLSQKLFFAPDQHELHINRLICAQRWEYTYIKRWEHLSMWEMCIVLMCLRKHRIMAGGFLGKIKKIKNLGL